MSIDRCNVLFDLRTIYTVSTVDSDPRLLD